jgi:hypothetical protein
MKTLAEQAVAAGYGADSYMSLIELIKKSAPTQTSPHLTRVPR